MHARKRRVESFEKMSGEGNKEKSVSMEKKKNNNRKVKKQKNMCIRE
jgi:hypothetical protein